MARRLLLARRSIFSLHLPLRPHELGPLVFHPLCSTIGSPLPSTHIGPPPSGLPHPWCCRTVHTPLPKIRIKKDRYLDSVAERETILRRVIGIRDTIMKHKSKEIPIRLLLVKKKELGLKMSFEKIQVLIKRYPTVFELFDHPKQKLKWCRLTDQMMQLREEEKRIHGDQEPLVVEKLRRLLMMSTEKKIRADKFDGISRDFGFPDGFVTSIVPKYPEFFCLVESQKRSKKFIELASWDDKIALSQMEREAIQYARDRGVEGEIKIRDRPLAFKLSYSRGMQVRKKTQDKIEQWQKLLYVSPYQDVAYVEEGTVHEEKRIVALLHEFLSLTIEKKTQLDLIGNFLTEYRLPKNYPKLMNRFPGIFYISLKGAIRTVFLREGYERARLGEEHPLVVLKRKYLKLIAEGPRVRSYLLRARRVGMEMGKQAVAEENVNLEGDHDQDEVVSDDQSGGHSEDSESDSERRIELDKGIVESEMEDNERESDDGEERHTFRRVS